MEATDLRIGNLFERDGSIIEAIRIAKDGTINYDLVKESKGMRTNGGRVKPIELTEELLLKCGFTYHEGDQSFELNEIAIKQTHVDRFVPAYKHTDAGWQYLKQCGFLYLHQLQNLYFALTQTELQITL